jgi:hypothetical protein
MVVHRHELRPTLANLCRLLTKSKPRPTVEMRPAQTAAGAGAH